MTILGLRFYVLEAEEVLPFLAYYNITIWQMSDKLSNFIQEYTPN